MAVCSFLGHRDIYDTDIEDRLQTAIERIVNENEAVEFLLYHRGDFSNQCILAALRVRSIFPEKVRITFILPEDYFEFPGKNPLYGKRHIPLCMADKIMMPHIEPAKNKKDSYILYRRTMQWMIQRSTHLVSCLYEDLCEVESRLKVYIASRPHLEIVDIASEKTVQTIAEMVLTIPEKEQSVYFRVKAGDTLKDIAKPLGVSSSRVQQILNYGCQKLRKHLNWKYLKVQFAEKGGRNQSCAIFSAGEITKEKRAWFGRIVDFLIEVCNVRTFYIEDVYTHSAFAKDLKQWSNSHRELRITAVVTHQNYPENSAELKDIGMGCCPPCHAVVCVGWADNRDRSPLGTTFDMIDLASFCLCDFTAALGLAEIRQYAARTKRTILLDLSRSCGKLGLQDRSSSGCDKSDGAESYLIPKKAE